MRHDKNDQLHQTPEEDLFILKMQHKYPNGYYNDNISPEIDAKEKAEGSFYVPTYRLTNYYSQYECPLSRIV